MSLYRIYRRTVIEVADHKTLKSAWKCYGPLERGLIGGFIVREPLTAAQLRRLPAALRDLLA